MPAFKMDIANEFLQALCFYLYDKHDLPRKFVRVLVVHNADQDRLNRSDPRAFCFVREEKPLRIEAAKALESLPDQFLLGVLYHELGHLVLGAFGTSGDEPKVDLWCTEFAPELRYTYSSVTYPAIHGGRAVAMNLQRVSYKPIENFAEQARKRPNG